MKRFMVETKGFGRIVREWIVAESKEAAQAKAEERHGISIKVGPARDAS